MSHPFGPLPRLGDYLCFLEAQSCECRTKVVVGSGGRSYRELVITNAAGRHYVMVNPDPDERLTLHVLGNIKRRLGIVAPYVPQPALPPPAPPPAPPAPKPDPGPDGS